MKSICKNSEISRYYGMYQMLLVLIVQLPWNWVWKWSGNESRYL